MNYFKPKEASTCCFFSCPPNIRYQQFKNGLCQRQFYHFLGPIQYRLQPSRIKNGCVGDQVPLYDPSRFFVIKIAVTTTLARVFYLLGGQEWIGSSQPPPQVKEGVKETTIRQTARLTLTPLTKPKLICPLLGKTSYRTVSKGA